MGKANRIHELTNILSKALRHKIGAIVNPNEIYAEKYSKDADILMREAQKIALKENWSINDKRKIKEELRRKLNNELKKKEFLDKRKFDIIEEEMNKALTFLDLKT